MLRLNAFRGPLRLVRPAAAAGTFNAGVIGDARRRQRRQRLVTAVSSTALFLGVLTGLVIGRAHAPRMPMPIHRSVVNVAPATVLAQSPYLGVACPLPNSIVCDRVGLAVWLRRPAVAVSATIAGSPLLLDWAGDRKPRFAHRAPRIAFDGFLAPAGLVSSLHVIPDPGGWWAPSPTNAPSPSVQLRITYGDGRILATHLPVDLSAGWG